MQQTMVSSSPRSLMHDGDRGCGLALSIQSQQILEDRLRFKQLAAEIRRALQAKTAVTLTLGNLGRNEQAVQTLEKFCSRLRDCGVPESMQLGICVRENVMPLHAFSLVSRCAFGEGPRYVMLEQAAGNNPAMWDYLWRFRSGSWSVAPVYGLCVSNPCPLLEEEPANAVLPAFGLHVPSETAWLPIQVHLADLADNKGEVCRKALDAALRAVVGVAEDQLGDSRWTSTPLRRDAQCNRRAAILVTGFGDLVELQNRHPADLAVLHSLLELARHVYKRLWGLSAELARRSEPLPALAGCSPEMTSPSGSRNRHWAEQWTAAVRRHAVKHRNLVVMSPYSVLPGGGRACAEYADLLPVIGCADAYSFAGPPPLKGWNLREFKHFHSRARAEIRRRQDASIVATRV